MIDGSTFNNSHKETKEALDWFRRNLRLDGGVLIWMPYGNNGRKRASNFANKPAGGVSKRGYIQVRKGIDKFMAHRIIWAMHYGKWPESGIDHINGDRLDNRIDNMRVASQYGNSKNAAKYPRKEPWIATGVIRRGAKWYAHAQVNKKSLRLGIFNCHTAAMIARKKFDIDNGFSPRHGAEPRVY